MPRIPPEEPSIEVHLNEDLQDRRTLDVASSIRTNIEAAEKALNRLNSELRRTNGNISPQDFNRKNTLETRINLLQQRLDEQVAGESSQALSEATGSGAGGWSWRRAYRMLAPARYGGQGFRGLGVSLRASGVMSVPYLGTGIEVGGAALALGAAAGYAFDPYSESIRTAREEYAGEKAGMVFNRLSSMQIEKNSIEEQRMNLEMTTGMRLPGFASAAGSALRIIGQAGTFAGIPYSVPAYIAGFALQKAGEALQFGIRRYSGLDDYSLADRYRRLNSAENHMVSDAETMKNSSEKAEDRVYASSYGSAGITTGILSLPERAWNSFIGSNTQSKAVTEMTNKIQSKFQEFLGKGDAAALRGDLVQASVEYSNARKQEAEYTCWKKPLEVFMLGQDALANTKNFAFNQNPLTAIREGF